MKIRAATESDLPAILLLLADDELAQARGYPATPTPEIDEAFAAIAADPHNTLYVGVEGGTVIGTFQLSLLPGLSFNGAMRAQVEAVRIASDRRGQGLGRELMTWVLEEARARGARMVQLMSESSRDRAHAFYTSLGFVPSHTGFKYRLS